jgi:ABC-type branched-subunit amino acid transport system substrate-binding protein
MRNFHFLIIFFLITLMHHLLAGAQPLPGSETADNELIRIGLLITEKPDQNPLMMEAVHVTELAGEIVNEKGGIMQKSVQIVVKSVDGNWGAGSKQAVSLIYEHQTTALLGFVDGRSAHLIEQVCTKAEIPFISTLSPDPSLSRINIPWFFSTLPHADQQAAALAEHLYSGNIARDILVVTSDDYDQTFISRSFADLAAGKYENQPATFTYAAGQHDFSGVLSNLAEMNAAALVFFGASDELESLAEQLTLANIDIPIHTPVMNLDNELAARYSGPLYTLRPGSPVHDDTEAFKALFFERYGYMPGIQTTYLYDGLQLLFRAIRENGEESEPIRNTLANMTEPATFDSEGVIEQSLTVFQLY